VTDDDAAVRARLAALEAEVKAETAAKSAAKAAALERLRQQKAEKDAERQALVARQAAVVQKSAAKKDVVKKDTAKPKPSTGDDIETALELARKARGVKEELTRPREANEKSWLVSGGLSAILGPLGWLYAGSFREAVPASAAYLLVATIIAKLPFAFVFWPAIMVAGLVSGIIGVAYSYQYNKTGKRQRLFGDKDKDKDTKKLAP
jgi:hypothetical protein